MRASRVLAPLLVLSLVASCTTPVASRLAKPTTTPQPTSAASASATAANGEQLVHWLPTPVQSLQPLLTRDATSESVWSLIYLPFLENDGDTGEPRPGLAESYSVAADGRTVTFTLPPGLVWSDGEPVTGEDYRYSIEALARLRLGGPLAASITGYVDYADGKTDHISGIVVRGAGRIVDVSLRRTLCAAARTVDMPLLPRHHFARDWDNHTTDTSQTIRRSPLNDAPPASVGPFQFERRTKTEIVLVRNERYFKGVPRLAGITFTLMDGAELRAAVEHDRISVVALPFNDLETLKQSASDIMTIMTMRVVRRPLTYQFIGWNPRSARAPWLADKRVRQALWHALDIDEIVSTTFGGFAHRVYAHTPEISWAYDGSALKHYDFDPVRSRQLLEEAGATLGADGIYIWRDGRPMRMRLETNDEPIRRAVLSAVVSRYQEIGIAVDPVVEPFATLIERAVSTNRDVDGFINGWRLAPDPDSFEFWHSTRTNAQNIVGFGNVAADRALEAGRYGPDCSDAARRRAYATVDQILNEEAPYTFLWSSDLVVLVSKRLDGVTFKPFNVYADIERWSFRQ